MGETDLISRQAAIDAVCSVCGNDCDKSEFVYNAPQDEQVILCPEHYCLCTLPSAQPKAGHWIEHEWAEEVNGMLISNYECSECHRWERYNSDFCPNCGARMEE